MQAFAVNGQPSHPYGLVLPVDPALLNRHVYTTAAVLEPGANSLGLITAIALDGTIGDY